MVVNDAASATPEAVRWLRRSYRAGAPLMAGWTALLLWADRHPLERRGVLPITVVPVIAGLMANDAQAVRAGRLSARSVAPVRALQLGLVGLFCYSHAKARSAVNALGEPV